MHGTVSLPELVISGSGGGKKAGKDRAQPSTKPMRVRLGEEKEEWSPRKLCADLPRPFEDFLVACRRLGYDEDPDYAGLRAILTPLAEQQQYYDWEQPHK